jgi:hypothetical protein
LSNLDAEGDAALDVLKQNFVKWFKEMYEPATYQQDDPPGYPVEHLKEFRAYCGGDEVTYRFQSRKLEIDGTPSAKDMRWECIAQCDGLTVPCK